MEQNQTNDAPAAAKKSPPLLSSSAGAKEGDNGVGITLFVADKTKENSPDLTGYFTQNGKKSYVAGWFIPAGVSAETKKPYEAFVSLRQSELKGGEHVVVAQGTLSGVNNWKGAPVDDTHRSRAIANIQPKDGGAEIVATGYATEELAAHPELATALGFLKPVVAESVAAPEADAPAAKGPRP